MPLAPGLDGQGEPGDRQEDAEGDPPEEVPHRVAGFPDDLLALDPRARWSARRSPPAPSPRPGRAGVPAGSGPCGRVERSRRRPGSRPGSVVVRDRSGRDERVRAAVGVGVHVGHGRRPRRRLGAGRPVPAPRGMSVRISADRVCKSRARRPADRRPAVAARARGCRRSGPRRDPRAGAGLGFRTGFGHTIRPAGSTAAAAGARRGADRVISGLGEIHGGSDALDREAPGAGPEPLVDLAAERDQPVPRTRPDPLAEGRPQPGRVPQADLRRAAREARRRDGARLADRLRLPPPGRVPQGHRLLGLGLRRLAPVAAGRLLLGRVRPAREPADLLGRPRRPGRRPPQERQRPGHPPDRRRPGLRAGVLPPEPRRQRLAGRVLPQRRPRAAADRAGLRPSDGKPLRISIDTHAGVLHAQVWRVEVGRTTLLPARLGRAREQRVRPRPDRPALRRRRPGPDPPGAAPRASAASGSCTPWASTRRCSTSTRATAPSPAWR